MGMDEMQMCREPTTERSGTIVAYKCGVCEEYFQSSDGLNQHMETHVRVEPRHDVCGVCNRHIAMDSHYVRHMVSHFLKGLFDCETCETHFAALVYHITFHPHNQPYRCNTCAKRFPDKRHLDKHVLKFHYLECNMCNQQFSQVDQLQNHMELDHCTRLRPLIECDVCTKTFVTEDSLRNHRKEKHSQTNDRSLLKKTTVEQSAMFRCDVCRRELDECDWTKTADGRILCDACRMSAGEDESLECDTCSEKFDDKESLVRHMSFHYDKGYDEENDYLVMDLNSTDVVYLKEPSPIVDSDEQLNCEVSNETFPLNCEMCNEIFTNTRLLLEHMDVHHKDQVFECDACGYFFDSARDVMGHLKIAHSDETASEHTIDSKFTKNATISSGRRQISGLERCDLCGEHFKSKLWLWKHKKTHQNSVDSAKGTNDTSRGINDRPRIAKGTPIDTTDLPIKVTPIDTARNTNDTPVHVKDALRCSNDTPRNIKGTPIGTKGTPKSTKDTPIDVKDASRNTKSTPIIDRVNKYVIHPSKSIKVRYKCDICGKDFIKKQSLIAHIATHNSEDDSKRSTAEETDGARRKALNFKCYKCGKGFRHAAYLRHMKMHQDQRANFLRSRFRCETCEKCFRNKLGLSRHMRKHKSKSLSVIDRNTSDEKSSSLDRYKCEMCGKRFKFRQRLVNHLITFSHSKDVAISRENYKKENDSHTQNDGENIQNDDTLECEICKKGFSSKAVDELGVHLLTHLRDDKPFKCEICGEEFFLNAYLQSHVKKYHSAELGVVPEVKILSAKGKKNVECVLCNKKFSYAGYSLHVMKHFKVKPFMCERCGKTFYNRIILRNHIRIHTGERPYKCTICDLSFGVKNILKAHVKQHTGERPYKCEMCPKKYVMRGQLVSHIQQRHSDLRPYKCEQCHKTFAVMKIYKHHLRLHASNEPFRCELCGSVYRCGASFKRHMFAVHGMIRSYKCERCRKEFYDSDTLKAHIEKH